MNRIFRISSVGGALVAVSAIAISAVLWLGAPVAQSAGSNPCNPCGMKANPCNPCGGKSNPCNPCNPCGGARIDPAQFKQPSGVKLRNLKDAALVSKGEKLWNDRSIGTTNMACSSCHLNQYTLMQPSFAKPYPHPVEMPQQRSGVSEVNAAEMVNFCMLVPMQSKPLAWDSLELAALTAYVEAIRPGYKPMAGGGANPCNPCGAKSNPCNPCNPCRGK